jgi:class 3 adenylate cyclase/tetratricopeptide (TPR) repeat protein
MASERGSNPQPEATVVVADIAGFTALAESLDPEAVTDLMNRCFAALEDVVTAQGGTVEQYVGDCVLAIFGLGESGTGGTHRGVAAAFAMRAAVRQIGDSEGRLTSLDLHVGVATGPVITGGIGSTPGRSAGVMGETVRLAEQLEAACEAGGILVCPRTAAETRDAFPYRALPPRLLAPGGAPVATSALDGEPRTRRRVVRPSERRQATVLFANVRGFSALYGSLPPERLKGLLDRCFGELEDAVQSYGGVVDKYVGECMMALFGLPNAIEHAPRQALNAAIDLRRRLAALQAEPGIRAALAVPLTLQIGINTGLVIAGEVGGRTKRSFTVMGDAVNLAARLRDAAGDGDVWVGVETHRATASEFAFDALEPLALKGKANPQPVFALRSSREQIHRAPRTTGGTTPVATRMVGREAELATLANRLRRLSNGQGGIVGIVGEAGLGKSRLLAELLQLEPARHVTVLEGRALAIGQGLSFHPFVDLLQRWAGIADADDEPAAQAKLLAALAGIMPGGERDQVFPFVATMMGMRPSGERAAAVDGAAGEFMVELILKHVRQVFRHLADARPAVVVFEDVHWADQSSIELLLPLLRLANRHRLLFVLLARPDAPETSDRLTTACRTDQAALYTEIRLGHLTVPQCYALIEDLLGTPDLPYATRELIVRRAEGNPFYIEEVIRSLVEDGAVTYEGGQARLTDRLRGAVIPGTVQEVVMSRVDRLDEPTRHVLQMAAAIGRSFSHHVIAEILGDEQNLDAILDDLVRRQLVRARETRQTSAVRRRALHPEREYVFTHAIVQETIYEAILQKTRQALHRRVARTIESIYADRLADFYGMLAYHYSRGEELVKAEEYLFQAGEEAARSAASKEALSFFRDASRLYLQMHGDGGDRRKKALLEQNIGMALLNTGDLTGAIEHFDAALDLLGEHVPRSRMRGYVRFVLDLLGVLGQLYVRTGRRREVTDWPRERQISSIYFNRGRAEITSDPTRLLFDLVGAFRRFNRVDMRRIDQASAMYASFATMFCYSGLSFAVSRRALAIAKGLVRPGNTRDAFTCASMEFIHHYLVGDWRDDWLVDEELVGEALRSGQLWDVNTYLGLYCDQRLRQGDFAAARALLARLDDINDSYGYAFAGANHDGMTALLLIEQRRLLEASRAAEDYTSMRHEDALRVFGFGTHAKAQLLLGRREAAERSLAAAERITNRSIEVPPWHLSAYAAARLRHQVVLLEEAVATGESTALLAWNARRTIHQALRVAAKASLQRTEIHQLVGRIWWLLGRRAKALHAWERALGSGARMKARPELARTWAVAGESLADGGGRLGGLDGAGCLARSLEMFQALGLEAEADAVRDRLVAAAPTPRIAGASGVPW